MDVPITIPGALAAASALHKAKATRPELDATLAEALADLAAPVPETADTADHQRARDAWTAATDACHENTDHRIRAAAELVEQAKLELLQAVYDAATVDDWSLRALADASGASRGTVANVLEAGDVKTVRSSGTRPRR